MPATLPIHALPPPLPSAMWSGPSMAIGGAAVVRSHAS
jgi:hypothetical protein